MASEDDRTVDKHAISWEHLNAFVDGELAAADAAAVAAAAARDSDVAARIASLAKLKAVVRALPQAPAPSRIRPFVQPQRGVTALGACAACLMMGIILATGVFWSTTRNTAAMDGLANAAIAQHEWLASRRPGERLAIHLVAADHALPDLSAASLQLAYLSLDPAGTAGGGIFAGYIGPNGCRLGFWMGQKHNAPPLPPHRADRDGLKVSTWRRDEREYALLSLEMDAGRLDEIAQIIASLPHVSGKPGEAQIVRLRGLQQAARPCAAS